ncbi:MAG: type II toxin-antitoxin system RelE/ParE family toxin [Bacteroidia bacterium]|nr:type II toxin-antitoxin system RelE/ParE family toxin [Bacteroidia bacterium]
MKYEIKLAESFKKAFKRLWKKYRSMDSDLEKLITEIEQNPETGVSLGSGIRKVRMAIGSKGKGKSHGARVITHTAIVSVEAGIITLLTLYDKADQTTITEKEISLLIKQIEKE